MQLLAPADYGSLQHLMADAPHDLAVAAIVAHDATGRVFVDNARHPQLALVLPHWGRLYILGKADSAAAAAVRRLLDEDVRPAAQASSATVFTLTYPVSWQTHVPDILAGKQALHAERQYYRWAGEQIALQPLPSGFTLLPADVNRLTDGRIANLQLLWEEMASERASVDDFTAHSFGVVAVHDDQLAGWCLSEYNTAARCEVGIATLEPFQQRGLAAAMGAAFLDMAVAHGIREVGWHCWKQNVPSAATALRIGLHHVADTPVHFGWYNEEHAPA